MTQNLVIRYKAVRTYSVIIFALAKYIYAPPVLFQRFVCMMCHYYHYHYYYHHYYYYFYYYYYYYCTLLFTHI